MSGNEDELQEIHDNYGTPDRVLLKEVRAAGFKPIGITVVMCEETFIFKGNAPAKEAAEKFLPEGWWYGLSDWYDAREEYLKEYYGNEEDAPIVYWLDKNFEPR